MDDCVNIAQRVAKEIAHLDVPVFLYGYASVAESTTIIVDT